MLLLGVPLGRIVYLGTESGDTRSRVGESRPPFPLDRVDSALTCCPFALQVVTMGLFRTIALFYLGSFDSIVRRCMVQKVKSEPADKTA